MAERTLAIITARGGSKRIPHKNIRLFCGKPIMAYSIEAAVKSEIFDEVMVSTEDSEIARIAEQYGAKVPFYRSSQTAGDYATIREVVTEVLQEYQAREINFDYVCCIYPTAPFITVEKLRKAKEIMMEQHVAEVTGVVSFSFPPQRGQIIDKNGFLQYSYPQYQNIRSQDLQTVYHDAGQFYFYNVKKYLGSQKDYKKVPFILPETEVQDIDNIEDWKIAELKYQLMRESKE